MSSVHKSLANGRWHNFSLAEQMGNIGSEVSRAKSWEGKDEDLFWGAAERALELFDLTISDKRWRDRVYEIKRAKEVFCDALSGGSEYGSKLKDLQKYFDDFALIARR